MAKVTIKNLVKAYNDDVIVKGINLEIKDGEFVVLVGPSGCGKSTTLRMIAGLEDINEGEVEIGDRCVNDLQPHMRNIAMVFQNYALYPHKTVRENIIFGLKKTRVSRQIIDERLAHISTMLQLENLLDRKPADLSGGQRQRVAMGRALARDADVYLFDEPLSNLDAKLRHHMRTEIAKIHKRVQTTSIYVTHDQVEAMTLGDRVVVMQAGQIEQVGTPMDIYLNPRNIFVATFIGSPSMNLLSAVYDAQQQVFKINDASVSTELLSQVNTANLKDGDQVKIGIRPDFFDDERFTQDTEDYWQLKNIMVDLVEPLGFDKEISFHIGGQYVKARLDLRSDIQEDDPIDLVVDPNRVLVFDAETGERI
ncbi:ABC transporter ATP-binding protein [Reinekea marinisedimentorum]|uniref:Multiple sugar transport system ATP-binding protein n=1 Tax=Reinekea marinisedimentorum TaxID=230495 RepID=A0A4R3IBT3_9GAMM|nr:sn-glycerol-3-phosphate ABC transporter ATP-binding protein UgpC [Reinekea marinisedimentorum]TCS43113.1 multiple sugar transport system ATP-binding protein [Reinekea marinisedimentorum]